MHNTMMVLLMCTQTALGVRCLFDEAQTRQMIRRHEGIRSRVYLDTTGHRTIGIGCNLERKWVRKYFGVAWNDIVANKCTISDKQIQQLFDKDFKEAVIVAVSYVGVRHFLHLHPKAQMVLIDMAFNLGTKLYSFQRMRKALFCCNYTEAAHEMQSSKWCKQVRTRGEELVNIMRSCQ